MPSVVVTLSFTDAENQLLVSFCKEENTLNRNGWKLPSDKQQNNESARDTALRILKEQLGITGINEENLTNHSNSNQLDEFYFNYHFQDNVNIDIYPGVTHGKKNTKIIVYSHNMPINKENAEYVKASDFVSDSSYNSNINKVKAVNYIKRLNDSIPNASPLLSPSQPNITTKLNPASSLESANLVEEDDSLNNNNSNPIEVITSTSGSSAKDDGDNNNSGASADSESTPKNIVVTIAFINEEGNLVLALGRKHSSDSWELCQGSDTLGNLVPDEWKVANILNRNTGVSVDEEDYSKLKQFSGNYSNLNTSYWYYDVSDNIPNNNESLQADGSYSEYEEIKFLKFSELVPGPGVESNDIKISQHTYVALQNLAVEIFNEHPKKENDEDDDEIDEIDETDENDENDEIDEDDDEDYFDANEIFDDNYVNSLENFKGEEFDLGKYHIIKTSGSGHNNCLGAAIGNTLVFNALYGPTSTQDFLLKDQKKIFQTELFNRLKAQSKDVDHLYDNSTANYVEAKEVNSFVALAAMPSEERDARLGKAMRDMLGDLFINDSSSESNAVRQILSAFEDALLDDFDTFLKAKAEKSDPKHLEFSDQFIEQKTGILEIFENLYNDSKLENDEDKKQGLQNWWRSRGHEVYGDLIKADHRPLAGEHGALLAAKFGLRFQYKSNSQDHIGTFQNGIDNDAPTIIVYFHKNHWSACLPHIIITDFNDDHPDNQIIIDEDAEKIDQVAKKKRAALRKFQKKQIDQEEKKKQDQQITSEVSFKIDESFFAKLHIFEWPEELLYNSDDKVITTKTGIELKLAAVDTQQENSNTLVITATNYKKPDTETTELTEDDLKTNKLESIAAAFAQAFIANGMPHDHLQIDIKKFGKNWEEEQVIKAFENAGFKLIYIGGRKVSDEYKRKEQGKRTTDGVEGSPTLSFEKNASEGNNEGVKTGLTDYVWNSASQAITSCADTVQSCVDKIHSWRNGGVMSTAQAMLTSTSSGNNSGLFSKSSTTPLVKQPDQNQIQPQVKKL